MSFSCITGEKETLQCTITQKGNISVSTSNNNSPFARARQSRLPNSIFIPQKEVLTLSHIIIPLREDDREFGFDETYYDLAKVIERAPTKGRNFEEASKARKHIYDIFASKASYDAELKKWTININDMAFDLSDVSEGIKKISILDILLGNRYIRRGSAIFIDEPEAGLHPSAVSSFADALKLLSDMGMQIFIATHSYFCLKKFENIARSTNADIKTFSHQMVNGTLKWVSADLCDGLPDNPIVLESIKLYQEEIDTMFNK